VCGLLILTLIPTPTEASRVFWETFDEDPSRISVQAYPFLTLGEPRTRDDLALDFKKLSVLFTPGSVTTSYPSPLTFPSPVTPAPSTGLARSGGRTTFTPLSVQTSFSMPSPALVSAGPVSASATWSILRLYGMPETPRASRALAPRKMSRAEWLDLPPVPPLPPLLRPPTPAEEKESEQEEQTETEGPKESDCVILQPPSPPPRSVTSEQSPPPPYTRPSRRPLPAVPQQSRSLPAIPAAPAVSIPHTHRRANSVDSPIEAPPRIFGHQHSHSFSTSRHH
jgi:hypothetical protein